MEDKSFYDTIDWLIKEKGYKEWYKENCKYPYIYNSLLEKRVESDVVCETNDKLCIHIKVTAIDMGDNVYYNFSVEIVAERNNLWWNLSCYSLNSKEIEIRIDEVEQTLIKLFNDINLSKRGIYSPDEYFD